MKTSLPFFIDENIAKAHTLSSRFYTEPSFFEASKDKIFARTWQWAVHKEELRLPEQVLPITLLPGFLDEPLLLTRTKDDRLHCVSNVCTHRGNLLVEYPCTQSQIRCRYHGKRFKLDGTFVGMPEFGGVEDFPSERDHLPKVPFDHWQHEFLFASVQPAAPLKEFIHEMSTRLSWLPLCEYRFDALRSRDYLVKAHWALYCENYLEGFHIPFVHPSLNAVVDYDTYTTEIYRYSNLQLGLAKVGEQTFDLPPTSPDYGKAVAAYYYWIFPNLMFNFYPWGLSVNIVKPIQPQLTKVSFLTYVYDESGIDGWYDIDKVEREDEAIVENVQRGIRSRFYDSGRYSAKMEKGTHHFHRLIAEFMNQ
ncbi:MAG: SRPBCC family protein [Spirosomataceae bacterium]